MRTQDSPSNVLGIPDCLELKAVFYAGYTVGSANGSDRDDELIVTTQTPQCSRTASIMSHSLRDIDVSLFAKDLDLDFNEFFTHDQVDGFALNEVTVHAGDDFP